MNDTKIAIKQNAFPFLLKEKFSLVATGVYIVLAIVFSFVERYYLGRIDSPEYIFKCVSLSYIMIAFAAMILPLLLIKKKKVILAVITAVGGLILAMLALYLTVTPSLLMWRATIALPFVLFLPYIWYFVSLMKRKY